MRNVDVPASVCEKTGLRISFENLDEIAVTAGGKKIPAVGGNGEVPRMYACILIANFLKSAASGVLPENGYAVTLETVAGVDEFAVRR